MTLRVILQIIPFGDEDKAKEIGRLNISNITHKNKDILTAGLEGMDKYVVERGTYKKYTDNTPTVYHHRIEGAWELVRKSIETIG